MEKRLNLAVFVDLSCDQSYEILSKSSELRLFNYDYRWLLWSPSYKHAISLLAKLNVGIDANITLASPEGPCRSCNQSILFYDVYKVNYNVEEVVSRLSGKWSTDNGLITYERDARNNFHGSFVNAGVVLFELKINQTFTMDKYVDLFILPEKDKMPRSNIEMYLDLQKLYNFTFNYSFTYSWGALDKNGSFNGLLGLMQRKEVEMGLTYFQFRTDRLAAAKFCGLHINHRMDFAFIQPSLLGTPTALITPFSIGIWLCLGCSVIILSFAGWIIAKWDPKQKERSLVSNFTVVVGHISQQGPDNHIVNLSSHILFFTLYTYAFCMYNYYNAAVLNGILSPVPSNINNLRQLLKSDLKIGVVDYPYMRDMSDNGFWGKKTKLRTELLDRISHDNAGKHSIFYSDQDSVIFVQKGNFAVLTQLLTFFPSVNFMRKFTDSQICNIKTLRYMIPRLTVGSAVPKTSPLYNFIAVLAIRKIENGIIRRMFYVTYIQFHLKCTVHTEATTIAMKPMITAFGILISGFIISSFIFILEIFNKKILNKNNKIMIINN